MQTASKKRTSVSCNSVETLEPRRMFAGNVGVDTFGGVTTLTGDSKSNSVNIVPTVDGYMISGVNGTTVNKQPSLVFKDTLLIKSDMGGGDDSIFLIGGSGYILDLHMGGGNDSIDVINGHAKYMILETGNGDDSVRVINETLSAGIGAGAEIDTGAGNDLVRLKSFVIDGSLSVLLGGGNDLLELLDDAGSPPGVSVTNACLFDGGKHEDTILIIRLDLLEPPSIINFEATILP